MITPVRIQRKRTKGWKMPPNTVYVGRPTKWGNPFVEGVAGNTREDAVRKYEQMVTKENLWTSPNRMEAVAELKGKNLACFCPLDKPCHADVLLKIANE